jgi:hypothetical protein
MRPRSTSCCVRGGARHVGVVEPLDAPEGLAEQLPFERAQRGDLGAVEAEVSSLPTGSSIGRSSGAPRSRRTTIVPAARSPRPLALRRGDDRDEADDVAPRQHVHGAQEVADERRARRQRQSVLADHTQSDQALADRPNAGELLR